MRKTLTQTIMAAIGGTGYLATDGLADYHAARKVKAALRRGQGADRLSGVREALNRYRVTAWLADNGKIELRRDGRTVAVI